MYNSFVNSLPKSEGVDYEALYIKFCIKPSTKEYNAYQCHLEMIPIYFDHKIADGMSTFQKLLYFGVYPTDCTEVNDEDCARRCSTTPLFKKCIDKNIQTDTIINPGNNTACKNMFTDLNDTYACPSTFYKNIIYNFSSDGNDPAPDYFNKSRYGVRTMTLPMLIQYYDSIGKFGPVVRSGEEYLDKYIKYKNKYLNLKKLLGGTYDIDNILKECFVDKYSLKSKVTSNERGGEIYIVENKSGTELILKSYLLKKEAEEYEITKKANELNVGPYIYDHCKQGNYGFIIMKKYKFVLRDVVKETKQIPNFKRIIKVFDILHRNHIMHNDASSSNWVYDNPDMSDLILIDYGDSEFKEVITSDDIRADIQMLILSLEYSAGLEKSKIGKLIDYSSRI